MQAFDPDRHAAGALGARSQRLQASLPRRLVPPGQVVLVGRLIRLAEVLVARQPGRHGPHRARRFQPAHRGGRPRAAQVVQRREGGTVRQPGRGLDHIGQAARAGMRDRPQAAGGAAELGSDHRLGLRVHQRAGAWSAFSTDRAGAWSAFLTDCHSLAYQGATGRADSGVAPGAAALPMIT